MSPSTALQSEAITHPEAADFYVTTLAWLLKRGILTRDMKVLVVCGADLDKEVFSGLGFRAVTISNLETDPHTTAYAPFAGDTQDVESLTCPDGAFDFCVAHNGLHHCLSPHRGLLEMFRVASKGIVVFEPRDSLLARLGVKLNFGQDYETAAVASNGSVAGGVRNTAIPNYVYRWTEREIEKTIASACAWGRPRFLYRYALRIPWGRLRMMDRQAFLWMVRLGRPALELLFRCFPKQSNGFAFIVLKPQVPQDLQPWVKYYNGVLQPDTDWLAARYPRDTGGAAK
jgi:SAM-dependent methyltransferase